VATIRTRKGSGSDGSGSGFLPGDPGDGVIVSVVSTPADSAAMPAGRGAGEAAIRAWIAVPVPGLRLVASGKARNAIAA